MCCFTIESVARSELILSISGNLLEGLIRFRPRIKTNDTHVERIFRKKNSGGKIKRKLITNGPFSPLGRLCEWMRKQYWTLPAITTRFLLQNGFSPPKPPTPPSTTQHIVCLWTFEMSMWSNFHHSSKDKGFEL